MAAATGDTSQSVVRAEAPAEAPAVTKVTIESRRRLVVVRLVVWFLFGVVFALIPLIAVGLREFMADRGVSSHVLLESGELFVISAVLSAGAIGELIATAYRGERTFALILSCFACLLMFAANSMGYMLVGGGSTPDLVVEVSAWLFLPTLVASGIAIGTAAGR